MEPWLSQAPPPHAQSGVGGVSFFLGRLSTKKADRACRLGSHPVDLDLVSLAYDPVIGVSPLVDLYVAYRFSLETADRYAQN